MHKKLMCPWKSVLQEHESSPCCSQATPCDRQFCCWVQTYFQNHDVFCICCGSHISSCMIKLAATFKRKKIPGLSCCVALLKIMPGLMAVEVLTTPLPRSKCDAGPGDNVPIVLLLQGLLSLNGQLQKIQGPCGGKKKCRIDSCRSSLWVLLLQECYYARNVRCCHACP